MEFWKRHGGRKPWIFRDRFQLAYLCEPEMSVAEYYHRQTVIADPALSSFLEQNIKPGQVLVDICSGMGGVPLLAAKLMQGQGTIFAVEPDAAAYRLLLNNIVLNGFTPLIRAIGRPVMETSDANKVLTLDALAESWGLEKIHLLSLPKSDDTAAFLSSAKGLLKRGLVERILCVGALEELRQNPAIKDLTTSGYVLHTVSADGALQPLAAGSGATGTLLVAVHQEAGRGG